MATIPLTERDLRNAMRDPRYWQSGHPERQDYRAWVTEGWRQVAGADAAGEGGGSQIVQVQAYERSRGGRREHVDGYSQSRRRGARPGSPARTAPSSPAPSQSPAELPPIAGPATPRGPLVVVFVGGFMDQTLGRAVEDSYEAFRRNNPSVSTYRFSHDEGDAIERLIQSQPPGTRTRLIGHSWGGNTAAEIADRMGAAGHPLDMLVTIDPVGNGTNTAFYDRVRQGTRRWINMNANGGSPWEVSNLIRRAGTPYNFGPMGHAHEFISAPVEHRQFGPMLGSRTSEGKFVSDEILAR